MEKVREKVKTYWIVIPILVLFLSCIWLQSLLFTVELPGLTILVVSMFLLLWSPFTESKYRLHFTVGWLVTLLYVWLLFDQYNRSFVNWFVIAGIQFVLAGLYLRKRYSFRDRSLDYRLMTYTGASIYLFLGLICIGDGINEMLYPDFHMNFGRGFKAVLLITFCLLCTVFTGYYFSEASKKGSGREIVE